MPPSEAQKRVSNKYNLEHNATLGCKVRKEEKGDGQKAVPLSLRITHAGYISARSSPRRT